MMLGILKISGSTQGEFSSVENLIQDLALKFLRIGELKDKDEENGIEDGTGIKLPSMEIARTFAVETIDYPSPLGLQ